MSHKEFVVVSLFDGMSCGQIALQRAGIKVDNYFASEIDKYAMQVTMANFPNTIQLGSVVDVDCSTLPKIDLLIGGSPCQSFSFAGKRKGMSTKDNIEILTLEHYLELKSQNFEFEGQSYLFWEYMRILEELRTINPNIKFLLENVVMGEKWQNILTKAIGINPIKINSALVSAQNRQRLYWTNIASVPVGFFDYLVCGIPQPKDKGILLKDILETDVPDKYFLSNKMMDWLQRHSEKRGTEFKQLDGFQKSACITTTALVKQNLSTDYIIHNTMPRSSKTRKGGTGPLSRNDGKMYCLDTGNTNAIEIQCVAMRGRNPENPKSRTVGLPTEQQLEPRTDGKTNCLTSVQKDNLIEYSFRQDTPIKEGKNKFATLRSNGGGKLRGFGLELRTGNIRRLTPTECERLQTVPDNYTNHVSDSQRYKMLGNGWTIDVIAHIFSFYK